MKNIVLAAIAVIAMSVVGVPGMSPTTAYAKVKAKPESAACAEITNKRKKAVCEKAQSAKLKKVKSSKRPKRSKRKARKSL